MSQEPQQPAVTNPTGQTPNPTSPSLNQNPDPTSQSTLPTANASGTAQGTVTNPTPTGQPANVNPATTNSLVPEGVYVPGGLNKEIVKPVQNPKQSDDNFPFSSGSKMHEVAQYQNFFTYPLDTYYNVFDAIHYFSDPKNRNRYNYEQQQNIISRIVRAALDFGISIEDVTTKLKI